MIQIDNLCFSYDSIHPILKNISYQIPTGAKIALIGQNGSGKTTFVKTLNRLCQPQSGNILVDGESILNKSIAQASQLVGYIFQNPNDQIFQNSVEKEIQYALRRQKLSEEDIQKRTQEVLQLCDLTEEASTHPYDLSITKRKFVCIASVLAMHPQTIILDEPTAGLDQKEFALLEHILNVLHQKGITTITITHDMDFVAKNFDSLLVMVHGQIVFDGHPNDFFYNQKLLQEADIEPPLIVRLIQALSIDKKIINIDQAKAYFQGVYQ